MSENKNNKKGIYIPDDAIEFSKLTLKRYKKKYADGYDSKKELRYGYYMQLTDLLPETIRFIVKYGYIKQDEIQECKRACFDKLCMPDYIKFLKKLIKDGEKIENIKILPIVLKEIVQETNRYNSELLATDPNSKIYDVSDIVNLSQTILKKKLKKFEKNGLDLTMAFDILSVIPNDSVLESSQNYRIHMLMDVLYEHAKSKTIPFEKTIKTIIGEKFYPMIIVFLLLERKEKFGTLIEPQKVLYMDISTTIFKMMEKEMSKEQLTEILRAYIRARRRDESQNRDTNRRFALSALSEADYPRISSAVNKMVANDDTLKKYLG